MELKLGKPIVFFDIEATGLSITQSRIVELCYLKVFPDGRKEQQTLRFNPTVPIEPQASKVNHIYDSDVAECPLFADKAAELAKVFDGSDWAGYNSNHFDVPLLIEEFLRAGINLDVSKVRLVDVQNIYYKMEPRTLSAAYRFYCNKNLEEAHTARADTEATYEILKAQLDRYVGQLENSIAFLSDFTRLNNNVDLAGRFVYNDEGVEVFNFGKFKGQPVSSILQREPGYYAWMMQGDFPQNTKQVLTRIKLNSSHKNS